MLTEKEVKEKIKLGGTYKIIDSEGLGLRKDIKEVVVTSTHKDGIELNGFLSLDYFIAQFYIDIEE